MPPLEATDDPADLGLDRDRLKPAYDRLAEWTGRGEPRMPTATLLVGREDRYLRPRSFGKQGPEPSAPPVREDGIYLLASITKPVVYTAALQLVEQGLLRLADPVVRHIPEFAANHKEGIRVLDLMAHTSGMPDMVPDNAELRRSHAPLERFIRGAIEAAPLFPPGTDFSYQSMGTLTVAELVQRLSGMSIRDYLRKHIFDPLGMNDSALGSDGLPEERLVRVETTGGEQAASWDWNSDYWRRFGAPWGGMFSTPVDFARLCRSLLMNPTGPERLLGPRTIAEMTTNQLDHMPKMAEPVIRAKRWGLGWELNAHDNPGGALCELLGPQVFGHYGATGTLAWLDPVSKMYFVLFTTGIHSKAPWRFAEISNIVAAAIRD